MTQRNAAAGRPDPAWCRTRDGEPISFVDFLERARAFHGYPAPGLIIGARMVEMARRPLAPGLLYDAISETGKCLPDAVQMLTPCTVGNGWLKVIRLGRYAVTLYDKFTGKGVRVCMDTDKILSRPNAADWFFRRRPKRDQDTAALLEEIRDAGDGLYSAYEVCVRPQFIERQHMGEVGPCPLCGESYPKKHGALCRGCQGDAPYFDASAQDEPGAEGPRPRVVPLEKAEGLTALHDMTRIEPGESKGPAIKKGQRIEAGDLCALGRMGRTRVYVDDPAGPGEEWIHENRAAEEFAKLLAGPGVEYVLPPREGKVNLLARHDGMLVSDTDRLTAFNLLPNVMCAARQSFSMVTQGRPVAATRAIPLYLSRADFSRAAGMLAGGPLFSVLPLKRANVGILVTGTEVFRGLVKDRFSAIVAAKVEALSCTVLRSIIVPDEREAIAAELKKLLAAGADLIVTTAGLSVDPDDVTRQGLIDAGARNLTYGMPALPGAMSLLADLPGAKVIGVPACALYFKTTAFDLLLPRVLAGVSITRRDLARMSDGAFCLECRVCTYPKCPFGK